MFLITGIVGVLTGILQGTYAIIAALLGIIFYLLTAVGLHKMAKNRGIKMAWLSWIPVFQIYIVGKLDNDHVFGIPGIQWWLLLFPIISAVVEFFFGTGLILGIVMTLGWILEVGAYYKLMDIYTNHPIIYTVTGIICAPLMGLWIFLHRDSARDTLVAAH